jgi:hypothetical protein
MTGTALMRYAVAVDNVIVAWTKTRRDAERIMDRAGNHWKVHIIRDGKEVNVRWRKMDDAE